MGSGPSGSTSGQTENSENHRIGSNQIKRVHGLDWEGGPFDVTYPGESHGRNKDWMKKAKKKEEQELGQTNADNDFDQGFFPTGRPLFEQ